MLKQIVFEAAQLSRNQKGISSFVRAGIVLGILLLAGVFGAIAKPILLVLIVVVGAGLTFFAFFSRRLEVLILLAVPVSFLVPIEIGTGTNVSLNATFVLSVAFIALWISRLVLLDKKVTLIPSRVNQPAILFIITTTLSLIIGNLNWFTRVQAKASLPAQLGGWALYIISVALFLVFSNQLTSIGWLKKITYLFIFITALPFIALLIPVVQDYVGRVYVLVSLTSLTRLWLTALAFGQLLWGQKKSLSEKTGLALCSFVPFIQSWLYDREFLSGWLPALIVIFILIWLRSWKWGIAVTLMASVVIAANFQSLNTSVMTTTQVYSTESRMATWPVMFALIKTSPILGLGLANYPYYTHLFPIYGYYIRFNSHNNYLDILAQIGLLGLLAFAWLMVTVWRVGWSLRNQSNDPFIQGYVYATIAGFVGTLAAGFMADWFLPFLYNVGFPGFRASFFAWLFLGGLVGLEHIINKREKIDNFDLTEP